MNISTVYKKTVIVIISLILFVSLASEVKAYSQYLCTRCESGELYCIYQRNITDGADCVNICAEEMGDPFPTGNKWLVCPPGAPWEDEWYPTYIPPPCDHVGGCSGVPRYLPCHEVYRDVKDFTEQFGPSTDFWYYTTRANGTEYKCMHSYKSGQGGVTVYRDSDYHMVNPVDNPSCMTPEAMEAYKNTETDGDCSHAPSPNAYNTGTYTDYGDPDSTTTCYDGDGDGLDDSTGVDCNVFPSGTPADNSGEPGDNAGGGGNGECPEGAPIWKVNMVNMNLFMTDIPLWYDPPIGPAVKVQLSYNSQAPVDQEKPFGKKWSFNFSSYLEIIQFGFVAVHMPDGRRDVYIPEGDGGHIRPAGVFNELTLQDTTYRLEFPSGIIYVYNTVSPLDPNKTLLSEIIDAYGQKLTLTYASGTELVEKVTDAVNNEFTFHDDLLADGTAGSDGLIDRVDDDFGRSASFTYYQSGDLKRITDMGGYWTEFTYDTSSYLKSLSNGTGTWRFKIEPPDGVISEETEPYPSPGSPMGESYRITVTNPLGDKEEYFSFGTFSWYVAPKDYIEFTAPDSNNYKGAKKTLYFLTESHSTGRIHKKQFPEGGYIEYRNYDVVTKKPKEISDFHEAGVSHSTSYLYNIYGRVRSFTDAKNNIYTYDYYPNNIDVETIKYDHGSGDIILKEFTYKQVSGKSTHDIETITIRPATLNNVTEFQYNPQGQLSSITRAKNTSVEMTTSMSYNSTTHNLEDIKIDGNIVSSFTQDTVGRVETHTDSAGIQVKYHEYNDLNQPTKITYPDTEFSGETPVSKYDDISYSSCCPRVLDRITDRTGQTTKYIYNAVKQLKEVHSPGGVTKFGYDKNGNRNKLTDSDGKETTFDYDSDNRLIKKTFADGKFEEYEYDFAGLLTKIIKARAGLEINFPDYDANHNIKTIDYPDPTVDISLTNDVTFTYDDFERLYTMSDGVGTYTYDYYDDNRIKSVDGPWDYDKVSYTYNELGHQKSLTAEKTISTSQVVTYEYDYETGAEPDIGRLKKVIIGGANTFTYDYTDVNPLVQKLTRPNGSYTDYLYADPLKRLTKIDNLDSSAIPQTINKHEFFYNSLDLIGTETVTAGTALPSFATGTTTYNNNNINQLDDLTNPDQTVDDYSYDDDGNMTQGFTPAGHQFTAIYDAESRLTTHSFNDGLNDFETKYFYSGDSMLAILEKWDDTAIPGTLEKRSETRYVRSGFLPLQERDGSNVVTSEYTWGLNKGGGIGGLLNLNQSGTDYSYFYDGKGNVMAVTDTNDTVAASYRYDVYGNLKAQAGTLNQPFMFSTKRHDELTGLSYYGYRFYNPTIGKWITRDPLGEAGGINLYQMGGNNSINFIDPWGLEVKYNGFVVKNKKVRDGLSRMDQLMPNRNIHVSGGDRYIDKDGNVRSATNHEIVPGSEFNSPHAYKNGARAVDIYVPGATDEEIKDAAARAGFPGYNTKQDYDDRHTHINLPNTPDNYIPDGNCP